jgi:transcriptional repressor NrdR
MKCPYCGSYKTRVVDKRDNREEGITRRRRECLVCFKRFTTYERIEHVELDVVKRNGEIEKFNREKLKRGIMKAVNKRPVTEVQVDKMIEDIEMIFLNKKATLIKSSEIGKMVLLGLRKVDSVSYMRFASVYKDFDTIEDFKKELNLLEEENASKN